MNTAQDDSQERRYISNLLRRQRGGIGGAAMVFTTKRLLLYRNGDPSFRPLPFVYNSNYVRTFGTLTDNLDAKVPPLKGGTVRKLYSLDGKTQITTLDQLKSFDGNELVVAGFEPYRAVKNGYASIGADNSKKRVKKATKSPLLRSESSASMSRQRSSRGRPVSMATQRLSGGEVPAKKIQLYKAADPAFRPKTFVYRKKALSTWGHFLQQVSELVPPKEGGPALHLYTTDGYELNDYSQLKAGESYVVAGEKQFRPPDAYDTKPQQAKNSSRGGLSPRRASQGKPPQSVRSRSVSPRPRSQRLHNRQDQTNPDQLFLFVFQNGQGLKATRCLFTPVQLSRGMPWLLEQVAKKFGVYPQKMCKMDGRPVLEVGELESKGAYVLVPKGELFRDTWYYLPDGSFDTSRQSEIERTRLGSRQTLRSVLSSYSNDSRTESGREASPPQRRRTQSQQKPRAVTNRQVVDQGADNRRHSEYSLTSSVGQLSGYSDSGSNYSGRSSHSHQSRGHSADSHCTVCDALERNLKKHHQRNHSRVGSHHHRSHHSRHNSLSARDASGSHRRRSVSAHSRHDHSPRRSHSRAQSAQPRKSVRNRRTSQVFLTE